MRRFRFITHLLELADVKFEKMEHKENIGRFIRERIKVDGAFVLRMLKTHSGVIVCTEVVDAMWNQYLQDEGTV